MLHTDTANTFGDVESIPWHVTPSGLWSDVRCSCAALGVQWTVIALSAGALRSSVPLFGM